MSSMGSPMPTTPLALSPALQKQIQKLSADCSFEAFAPDDGKEDLVLVERKNAEDAFQRAFCKRIWWRLSPEQRSQIRSFVRGADSYHKDASNEVIDMYCLQEIKKMLLR